MLCSCWTGRTSACCQTIFAYWQVRTVEQPRLDNSVTQLDHPAVLTAVIRACRHLNLGLIAVCDRIIDHNAVRLQHLDTCSTGLASGGLCGQLPICPVFVVAALYCCTIDCLEARRGHCMEYSRAAADTRQKMRSIAVPRPLTALGLQVHGLCSGCNAIGPLPLPHSKVRTWMQVKQGCLPATSTLLDNL